MARLLPCLCLGIALCCVMMIFEEATAFTGATRLAQGLQQSRTQSSALPLEHGDLLSAMTDASSIVLADDAESIPAVAFTVSVFVGIVGYSTWTAFGPASAELRDPFEEHED
ncbi:unnamed protein product [Effrenium voratum]|nr:unnamed protein product [Effrenium voratum]